MKNEIKLTKENYIDRDISWMYFNYRILKEAERSDVPLYERLNFLGIYSSNLDEFFKVRVAALKSLSESNLEISKNKKEVYNKVTSLYEEYSKEYSKALDDLFNELRKEHINLLDSQTLTSNQKEKLREYYIKNINGFISPIIITKKSNLSFINDESIYLIVELKSSQNLETSDYAIVPIPFKGEKRFITLESNDVEHNVIYIDDVIRLNLDIIFKPLGYDVYNAYSFKFSRDAELEIESDPDEGMLKNILQAVKDRKKGLPVRIILETGMPKTIETVLLKKLNVKQNEFISYSSRYHNNKDLMAFPKFNKNLEYLKWTPKTLVNNESLIDKALKKDILISVPYMSYDLFIKFLQEISVSKNVTQIKSTIYRAAKESLVVSNLVNASLNGKKVTCLVELLARFNESSNVLISKKLQDAGAQILDCKEGFKVHGKVMFIKLKTGKNLAVISTGNFHEGNAKTYTDNVLITSRPAIVNEVAQLFEYLETPYKHQVFKNLLVSPNHMFMPLKRLIKNEIKNANNGLKAEIRIKVNHLTDKEIIKLLYEAANANVKIKLLVRTNCSLVLNTKALKENIEIHAIIDKYLEHNRIFIFENGGQTKYYIGSSDLMERNLYNRVEVMTPILDDDIKKEIEYIFDLGFNDNTHSFVVNNSTFTPYRNDLEKVRSQEELFKHFNKEN